MKNIYKSTPFTRDINYNSNKNKVLKFFLKNKEQMFKASEICEKIVFSKRGSSYILRMCVADLRDDGHPIASSSEGFMYTKDKDTIKQTILNLERRMYGILRARNGLTKSLKTLQ